MKSGRNTSAHARHRVTYPLSLARLLSSSPSCSSRLYQSGCLRCRPVSAILFVPFFLFVLLFYCHRHLRLSCPLRLVLPLPTACLLPLLRLLFHRHICFIFVFRSLLGASLSEIIIIKTTITYRGSILSRRASVFFFSSTSCPVLSITSSSKLSAYFSII